MLRRTNPYFFLRLGLGLAYLWSGWNMRAEPDMWHGFVPAWFMDFLESIAVPLDSYLRFQGWVELAVGVLLLLWFLDRWRWGRALMRLVYVFIFAQVLAITWSNGIDIVTFRDFVYLGASLALLAASYRR